MNTIDRTRVANILCLAATLAALAACGTYKPGTLGNGIPGAMHTVGCLDVVVESLSDARAEGPAARLRFGNRCNAAVPIDFTAIAAVVRYRDGHVTAAHIYDPERTLRPVLLDVGEQGWEAFEYQPIDDDHARVPQALCLDLAGMDGNEPGAEPVMACVEVDTSYLLRTASSEEGA